MEFKIDEKRIVSLNYELPSGKIVTIEMEDGEVSDIFIVKEKKKLSENERCREIINVLRKAREEMEENNATNIALEFVKNNPFDINKALVGAIREAKAEMVEKNAAELESLKMSLNDKEYCDKTVKFDNDRIESMQAEPKDFTDSGTAEETKKEEAQEKETE